MSANKGDIGSDLRRVDAHEVGPADLAEIAELDDEWFRRARPHRAGELAPASRQNGVGGAETVRLSSAVIAHFRATDPGWENRINEVLEEVVRRSAK